MEVQFFQNVDMFAGTFNHCFSAWPAIFFKHCFFQRTAVDADADRDMMLLAGFHYRRNVFPRPDVAGIDADLIDARFNRG